MVPPPVPRLVVKLNRLLTLAGAKLNNPRKRPLPKPTVTLFHVRVVPSMLTVAPSALTGTPSGGSSCIPLPVARYSILPLW